MRFRHRRGAPLTPVPQLAAHRVPVRRTSGLDDATAGLPGDARTHLDQLVQELAGAGALDEGTGDLLDELIESWRAQHHGLIDVFYLGQRNLAEQARGAVRARLASAQHRLAEAERRVAQAEAVLEAAQAAQAAQAARPQERSDEHLAHGEVPAPRAAQEAAA